MTLAEAKQMRFLERKKRFRDRRVEDEVIPGTFVV